MRALLAAVIASAVAGWTQGPPARATQALIVFQTPFGFEPAEATVRPGRLLLVVRSRIGGDASYEISSSTRSVPDAVLQAQLKKVSRREVVLTPGEYFIQDPRFPSRRCRIVVRP